MDRHYKTRVPWIDFIGLAGALAGLVLLFSLITDHFFTITNFQTIANQIPTNLVIAVGMTMILISGGIDLSVGSVLALSSAVFGITLLTGHAPFTVALLAGIATGLLCGGIVASVVVLWNVPSFIVTLGMLEAARGATYLVTKSQTQYIGSDVEWIASGSFLGLSISIWTALVIILIGHVVLTQTAFGRHLMALGQNETAAHLSGIDTKKIRWIVFAAAGGLTAIASILHTARLSAADPNAGIGLELNVIAAVVIGGTSLSGGRGSVLRSAVGVLIIAVLGSGLAHTGAQEPLKRLITGLVIVGAVVLDQLRHRQ